MDRTVPRTGSDPIQLYMRTYYSLLRSSDVIRIETLIESHATMESSLHAGAADFEPDVSALIYASLRLPPCIRQVEHVLIGQIEKSFIAAGYVDIPDWQRVFAPGRRRRMHFDGNNKLVVYIGSRSDIDDLVPILTAYQIEWNKLHTIMRDTVIREFLQTRLNQKTPLPEADAEKLAGMLMMDVKDVQRLEIVWDGRLIDVLWQMAQHRKNMGMVLISGSLADYRRATATWWEELCDTVGETGLNPENHPIYFVSSNTHSIVNLLTGIARRHETSVVEYIKSHDHESLLAEYESLQESSHKSMENFLYYVLGKYVLADDKNTPLRPEKLSEDERTIGIYRVPNKYGFEIEAQVIELNKLLPEWLDPRLQDMDLTSLVDSDAIILNIDYPLGMAAYEILSRITERNDSVQGVYIMGKAATLNGRIGDVMIPNVTHDEHSQNTYLFDNCFAARDVSPYMSFGNVLDNQKAVTALGTFLQNPVYMSVFYREGYTDIEMEGGPYLSAIYEAFRPKRHPYNEIVNLYGVPFDVGFLHYASDSPMKGKTLGAGSLQYMGVEPTYATAIAILRRIFLKEAMRLQTLHSKPAPAY